MKTCPLCRGEAKIPDDVGIAAVPARKPFISQLAELIPNDLMQYTFGLAVVGALTFVLHAWIVAPPKPADATPELQCATACGGGPRFKAYSYPVGQWNEPDGTKWGKVHDPKPAKCECIVIEEKQP